MSHFCGVCFLDGHTHRDDRWPPRCCAGCGCGTEQPWTGATITDAAIRRAYDEGLIGYSLLEFATFPAWAATHSSYRERCAEIINASIAENEWKGA